MKYYAGIGSRNTPCDIIQEMIIIAKILTEKNYCLRSGGSSGADSAFEEGCDIKQGMKEIFLPWKHFNGNKSQLYNQLPESFEIAQKHHQYWYKCSNGSRKLLARNVHQILGKKLDQPVEFIICWTNDGKDSGGTGLGIRIAKSYNIPIYNLKNKKEYLKIKELLK